MLPESLQRAKYRYQQSPKGKATQRRYNHSKKHKLAARKWAQSAHGKKCLRRIKRLLRIEVLTHYCVGVPHCMCKGCKVTQIDLLDLHHTQNNGARHRELIGGSGALLTWLRKHKYPKGYKVICANCHRAYHAKVACQH